mgnify:CR=1 FL=1
MCQRSGMSIWLISDSKRFVPLGKKVYFILIVLTVVVAPFSEFTLPLVVFGAFFFDG